MQSVCIILHAVCMCKFTYPIKVICNPQINTCGAFVVTADTYKMVENGSRPTHPFQAEVGKGSALPPCLSSHTINRVPPAVCLVPHFLTFVLLVGDSPVTMVPKCRVELLPRAPKCRKAEMCLLENIRVSAELCSGMSDSAVGHKVHVNELKMSIK